jgi:hypothetical protein
MEFPGFHGDIPQDIPSICQATGSSWILVINSWLRRSQWRASCLQAWQGGHHGKPMEKWDERGWKISDLSGEWWGILSLSIWCIWWCVGDIMIQSHHDKCRPVVQPEIRPVAHFSAPAMVTTAATVWPLSRHPNCHPLTGCTVAQLELQAWISTRAVPVLHWNMKKYDIRNPSQDWTVLQNPSHQLGWMQRETASWNISELDSANPSPCWWYKEYYHHLFVAYTAELDSCLCLVRSPSLGSWPCIQNTQLSNEWKVPHRASHAAQARCKRHLPRQFLFQMQRVL